MLIEDPTQRSSRPPDHAAESHALVAFADAMAGPPQAVLDKLVSLALKLCRADSAGISVLEEQGDGRAVFRCHAIAGMFSPYVGGTMPRSPSPCGVVVDRNAALLIRHPARYFDALPATPPTVEALLVPFHDGTTPVGTVWALQHGEERTFDAEDARLLTSLSRLAACAVRAALLHESEGRYRFLAELAAATQPLADPGEILAVAAHMLAEHLDVDRCAYGEVEDERTFVITGDYTRGVPSIVGRWPIAAFGSEYERCMRANEPYVIDDVSADPQAGNDLAAYRATSIQAVICIPLHKAGKFTAGMAVHQKTPRRWTPGEIGLVRLVVGRCWEALERARMTREVRERDERLDYAARLSGVGVWYCDLPFNELIWDDRVKEHFWLPPDARVTSDMFYDRLHPDDREPTRQAIEAALRDHTPYNVDYRTVDPVTGASKWIRALGGTTYAPDGTPRRFDGVTLDVTASKLGEEQLTRRLEQKQEQARLLKEVADAALTIHSSGSLDSVLQAITEEARRIIGTHQSTTSLTVGDDWSQAIVTVSMSEKYDAWRSYEAPPNGKGIYTVVCRTNRPMRLTQAELLAHPAWRNFSGEGSKHPPLRGWLAAPFISQSGKNLGLIQLSDKYEGEFTDSDEAILVQLAHLASVAIENARLYGELRDQDRRKDEFLATLAHELRNPLAPIRTGLQILQVAWDGNQHKVVLDMMERQVGHMVRMVDDLLDLSRITRGKVELRKERAELRAILDSALETSRPLIEAAGHMLAVELPAEPLVLDADPTRLAQVFANLLNNAAKYTPTGGHIWVTAQRDGGAVVVRVADTGIGIPADMLPKVFDMFVQIGRSMDWAQGGLGIGLTLVKRMVELHGGTIHAESEGHGRGATFTVRLPLALAKEAVSMAAAAGLEADRRSAGLRVLVVDDNVDGAETLAMLLQISGQQTQVAHSGSEALAAARTFGPDMVFLDIGLPDMNGYEVARRLRAEPAAARLILVALTGWGAEDDRRQAREAGFDHHLTKPANMSDMERLIGLVSALRMHGG